MRADELVSRPFPLSTDAEIAHQTAARATVCRQLARPHRLGTRSTGVKLITAPLCGLAPGTLW